MGSLSLVFKTIYGFSWVGCLKARMGSLSWVVSALSCSWWVVCAYSGSHAHRNGQEVSDVKEHFKSTEARLQREKLEVLCLLFIYSPSRRCWSINSYISHLWIRMTPRH